MAIALAEGGTFYGTSKDEFRVDLHTHVPDANPTGNTHAGKNTSPGMKSTLEGLLRRGKLTAVALAAHDGYPQKSLDDVRRDFPDVETLGVNEVTAGVPSKWQRGIKRLGNFVHFIAIFPEKPKDWDYDEPLEWPSLRERRAFINDSLPPADQVMMTVKDQGGVLAIAHPIPLWFPLPWASLNFGEIKALAEEGKIPADTAIEVNGSKIFSPIRNAVEKFARKNGFPVIGGSDAHEPKNIARRTTVFPRSGESGTIWESLKQAVKKRTTRVV